MLNISFHKIWVRNVKNMITFQNYRSNVKSLLSNQWSKKMLNHHYIYKIWVRNVKTLVFIKYGSEMLKIK